MFWPKGWVCQAVRAPGVKWTLAAPTREGAVGVAIVSMKTEPVNQSAGPGLVSRLFLVICMLLSLIWVRPKLSGSRAHHDLQRLALVHCPIAVRHPVEVD